MNNDLNFWGYFLQASLLLKMTLLILGIASISTWTIVLKKALLLRKLNKVRIQFENQFWSGVRLHELYNTLPEDLPVEYLSAIFQAGFMEFYRLRNAGCQNLSLVLEAVARAMRVVRAQAETNLERPLNSLALIGSSTPYLGVFGTVWGMMSTFGLLAPVHHQSNTLMLVAPGISEALTATIIGLFTAIPAIVFYNYYVAQINQLLNRYDIFQEEFIALLLRQAYEEHVE